MAGQAAGKGLARLTGDELARARKRGLVIWSDRPEANPARYRVPTPVPEQVTEIRLRAAQSEHRAATVNLFNPFERAIELRAVLSVGRRKTRQADLLRENALTLYRAIYIESGTDNEFYADALEPLGPSGILSVPSGECRQLWLDLATHHIAAGSCEAVLEIKSIDPHVVARNGRGFVTSRRWEAWREGMQDYLYLHVLRELMRGSVSNDPGKGKLEKAGAWMSELVSEVAQSSDPAVAETARIRVAGRILEWQE